MLKLSKLVLGNQFLRNQLTDDSALKVIRCNLAIIYTLVYVGVRNKPSIGQHVLKMCRKHLGKVTGPYLWL